MLMTYASISALSKPGRYTDDLTTGLHLWIRKDLAKYWIFRYTLNNQRKSISLGAFPSITLKEARKKATDARNKVNQGLCPSAERKALKKPAETAPSPLFSDYAVAYIERMRPKQTPRAAFK